MIRPITANTKRTTDEKAFQSLVRLINAKVEFLLQTNLHLNIIIQGDSLESIQILMFGGNENCWKELRNISGVSPILMDALRVVK